MKILVTGSAGLVGSACVDLFKQQGHIVTEVDNNARSKFFGVKKEKLNRSLDITVKREVDDLFSTVQFDAIVHAAAQPSHDYATDHVLEDFDTNARGTVLLLEATRKYCPDSTFIHISTDKVYGEHMSCMLVEGDTRFTPKSPFYYHGFTEDLDLDFAGIRSFFGCSKVAADLYAQEYANRFGMNVMIFRPGCITGKNHKGAQQHGFLSYLAKCIKEREIYKIYGFQGKQVRDQIHASDFATAIGECIRNPIGGAVYNIGGGLERSISVLEAADMIANETNLPFLYEHEKARVGDRPWDVHNIDKFRHDYPEWNYEFSLQDIITDLCED